MQTAWTACCLSLCFVGVCVSAEHVEAAICPANSQTWFDGTCWCLPGFAGSGGSPCSECGAGTHKPRLGDGVCVPCAAGTYASYNGTAECTQCPAGTYAPWEGLSACDSCPPDTYSVEGMNDCNSCVAGKYLNSWSYECATCPQNMTSPAGATSYWQCVCGDGYDNVDDVCVPECAAGSRRGTSTSACTCDAGYTGNDGGPCYQCDAGKYKYEFGPSTCVSCSVDFFLDDSNSHGREPRCRRCEGGRVSAMGSTSAYNCECVGGSETKNSQNMVTSFSVCDIVHEMLATGQFRCKRNNEWVDAIATDTNLTNLGCDDDISPLQCEYSMRGSDMELGFVFWWHGHSNTVPGVTSQVSTQRDNEGICLTVRDMSVVPRIFASNNATCNRLGFADSMTSVFVVAYQPTCSYDRILECDVSESFKTHNARTLDDVSIHECANECSSSGCFFFVWIDTRCWITNEIDVTGLTCKQLTSSNPSVYIYSSDVEMFQLKIHGLSRRREMEKVGNNCNHTHQYTTLVDLNPLCDQYGYTSCQVECLSHCGDDCAMLTIIHITVMTVDHFESNRTCAVGPTDTAIVEGSCDDNDSDNDMGMRSTLTSTYIGRNGNCPVNSWRQSYDSDQGLACTCVPGYTASSPDKCVACERNHFSIGGLSDSTCIHCPTASSSVKGST